MGLTPKPPLGRTLKTSERGALGAPSSPGPEPGATGFRRVLAAEVTSNFGSMLSRLAIPWLALITLGATPWQMSWLLMADVAAAALGALLLGGWVDRSAKRAVMVACDVARAALLAALALAAWLGQINMVALACAAAASGLATATFELARSAWMAQALPAQELPTRNAQLSVGGSLAETAAFALGGWLFHGLGAALALLFDALSYCASGFFLRGVKAVAPADQPACSMPSDSSLLRSAWHDIQDGMAVIQQHPLLRRLALLELLLALSSAQFATCYLAYLSHDMAIGTGLQGLLVATGAVGSMVGAWLTLRWGTRWGPQRAMALGLLLAAVAAFCVPLAADAALWGAGLGLALLVAHQVAGDAGMTAAQTQDRSLRQTLAASHQLALVDGALRAIGHGAMLIGAVLAGVVATAWGNRSALMLAAALLALAAASVWRGLRPEGLSEGPPARAA